MKYKAVLFDLDGTLLDTLEDLKSAVNYVLRKHKEPEITIEQARYFVGNGARRLIALALKEGEEHPEFDLMFEEFFRYYVDHDTTYTTIYPGIPELLSYCKKQGLKIGVVSNKYEDAVSDIIPYYFPDTFDTAYGEIMGVPRKPDPALMLMACKELDVDPKETLYIGDSEVDADFSENVGMDYILCSWGFKERCFLEKRNPKLLADHPSQIVEYLQKS